MVLASRYALLMDILIYYVKIAPFSCTGEEWMLRVYFIKVYSIWKLHKIRENSFVNKLLINNEQWLRSFDCYSEQWHWQHVKTKVIETGFPNLKCYP